MAAVGEAGGVEKESPLHGSQASENVSGPAQGSAPPVDKRSILSISLSAPDNKQKFSKPRSCLVFEMCILLYYTHAAAHLHSHTSGTDKQTHNTYVHLVQRFSGFTLVIINGLNAAFLDEGHEVGESMLEQLCQKTIFIGCSECSVVFVC